MSENRTKAPTYAEQLEELKKLMEEWNYHVKAIQVIIKKYAKPKFRAYIAYFQGEDWCTLIHGASREKAKYRFLKCNPIGREGGEYTDIRLLRVPGLDNKVFTYQAAKEAGFEYHLEEGSGELLPPEEFYNDCNCELCRESKR